MFFPFGESYTRKLPNPYEHVCVDQAVTWSLSAWQLLQSQLTFNSDDSLLILLWRPKSIIFSPYGSGGNVRMIPYPRHRSIHMSQVWPIPVVTKIGLRMGMWPSLIQLRWNRSFCENYWDAEKTHFLHKSLNWHCRAVGQCKDNTCIETRSKIEVTKGRWGW